jgi:O-methyltransferase involved in polyketide biosynthesis
MYLTRDAVAATLGYVAGRPRGSGVTFDYMLPPNRLSWFRRIGFHLVARRVAKLGEPWKTWYEPDTLAAELRTMGFTQIEELDGLGLNERYFGGREQRLGGASVGRVITAVI